MGELEKSQRGRGIGVTEIARGFVSLLCLCLAAVIFFYGMRTSFSHWDEEKGGYTELFLPRVRDDLGGNVISLLAMLVGVWLIYHFIRPLFRRGCLQKGIPWFFTAAVLLLSAGFVISLRVIPILDPGMIVAMVEEALRGDWHCFEQGQYMSNYFHQAGLFGVLYFLGGLFPQGWRYYQFVNCLALGGIAAVGSRLAERTGHVRGGYVYRMLLLTCVPAYLYTAFIYGELLSTFLCLCAVLTAVLALEGKDGPGRLFLLLLFMFGGIWIRKNSLIVLAALVLYALWKALADRRPARLKIAAALLLSLVPYFVCGNLIFRDRIERHEGIPAAAWVVMGMEKSSMGYGYFNSFATLTFAECGYDAELTRQVAHETIGRIAAYYLEHPREGLEFYKEKVLWQWTDPSFESMFCTREFENRGLLREAYYGDLRSKVWRMMEWQQNFVYFGLLVAFGAECRRKSGGGMIFQLLFLGAFFFSVLWEAKPRYVFMGYMMILPMAARGIGLWCVAAEGLGGRLRDFSDRYI